MTHDDSRRDFGNDTWCEGANLLKGHPIEKRQVVIIAPNFTNQEERFAHYVHAIYFICKCGIESVCKYIQFKNTVQEVPKTIFYNIEDNVLRKNNSDKVSNT